MKNIMLTLLIAMFFISCITPQTKTPDVKVSKTHKDCGLCHLPHQKDKNGKMLLTKPLSELCSGCHQNRIGKGEHKVGIKLSAAVEGLPLDVEGKMSCITCHDPHGSQGFETLLRTPTFSDLCKKCHKYN